MSISGNDKLKDFPTRYTNDISSINDELHFKKDGSPTNIKYTGTATISGDLNVTGNITSTFNGNIDATNVVLSGGNNVETELSTIVNLNNAILDQARDFERRAEEVRKLTPSGFSEVGDYPVSWGTSLSSLGGLEWENANVLLLGGLESTNNPSNNREFPKVVVNGYNIKVKGEKYSGGYISNILSLPAPPTTGTRQDLVFIEVWKEEVDKATGLFFPYGNTQYASSENVDGSTLNNVQTGFTGSAYFTSNGDVYCVDVNSVSQDFLANPEHNIGVLENGNFFQVRYRIRVEADISVFRLQEGRSYFSGPGQASETIRPQGQKATAPSRGNFADAEGIIIKQTPSVGTNPEDSRNFIQDQGLYVGLVTDGGYDGQSPISNISLDGFTYAVPVCAIHRRNTGVYSLGNQNGTAFEDAWIVEIDWADADNLAPHGSVGQTLVSVGSSTFKVAEVRYTSGTGIWARFIRMSGSGTPIGTASWDREGSSHSANITIATIDDGTFLGGSTPSTEGYYVRPDKLYSNIIDRRDVLDLRHKVSLTGVMDKDELYQETLDLVMKGEYRQEWEKQKDYDADGNGLATIDSGIYGNVLLETLGLGATVPDSHINTDITKVDSCNNGTPIGFNGARTQYSEAQSTEEYTAVILDQSSPQVLDSADNIVTFNSVTKTISVDMTQHSSYINDVTKDPTILKSHLPVVKWGNGANVAGVWTRTNDYNWSFEVKEYGTMQFYLSGTVQVYNGDIYRDSNGNDWEVVVTQTSGTSGHVIPKYSQHNGSVIPSLSSTMTLQSGRGVSSFILHNSISSAYVTNTHPWWSSGHPIGVGYSNSAHGISSTESIFSTIKLDYKVGSSCLPEVPYGDDMIVLGGKVFINGTEVDMPESFRPMGGYDKATKTVKLTGFSSRKPITNNGASGSYNDYHGGNQSCLLKHGSTYKVWFTGYDGSHWRIMYMESSNGIDWSIPELVLDLGSNGDIDDTHTIGPSVIIDGSTYKMWYTAHDGIRSRIAYATSSNGKSWTKQGVVLNTGSSGEFDDSHVHGASVIKDGSTYKMWYGGHDGYREDIGYATSSNGTSWTKHGKVIDRSEVGASTSVAYCNVIKDGNLYKMFWSAYLIGEGLGASDWKMGYSVSSNGINWHHKGLIYQNIDGAHAPSVIKDGSSYKMLHTDYATGRWQLVYSVLAMSDPNNTGTSTTGVYTNTNPQVNFGFTSNDTIVLHYERIAQQKSAKAETLDVWPKDVSWVSKPALGGAPTTAFNSLELTSLITYSRLGTILRLDPSQYSINSNKDLKYRYGIYMTSALDYVEEYYRINYGTSSYEGFTFEDVRMNITPDSNILKGDYSRITFSSPAQYRLNGSQSDKNEETLNCLIGTSIAKRDNGEVIMLIGFVNASIHHPIFYAIGALGATIPMLGRPLLK